MTKHTAPDQKMLDLIIDGFLSDTAPDLSDSIVAIGAPPRTAADIIDWIEMLEEEDEDALSDWAIGDALRALDRLVRYRLHAAGSFSANPSTITALSDVDRDLDIQGIRPVIRAVLHAQLIAMHALPQDARRIIADAVNHDHIEMRRLNGRLVDALSEANEMDPAPTQ
jgi:hypothetical protein